MATATKRRKVNEPSGMWRCAPCGCENPVEATHCQTCEVERGARKASNKRAPDARDQAIHDQFCPNGNGIPESQAEAATKEATASNGHERIVGLENGRVAWECRFCATMNYSQSPECGNCRRHRGDAHPSLAEGVNSESRDIPEIIPAAESSRRRAPKRKGERASPAAIEGAIIRDVPLASLNRRADNPRQAFDLVKLEKLAESIREIGLISPIVVREIMLGVEGRKKAYFEVWAGERRVRACELLGAATIGARVFGSGTPDSTMEAIRAWENLQREDLDPIEEARSLQQLLSSGAYASQKELGEALGLSQGEVSLRIRLTDLPAEWQQRVIAHDISTSHAKHLYAWSDLPQVLKKATQKAAEWQKSHGRKPSERDFQSIVQDAARAVSKPINKPAGQWDRNACPFTVSKELRTQLDVRPVPNNWGGTPSPRAFNVTLWNQKAKEAKQRAAEKAKSEPEAKQKTQQQVRTGPEYWVVCERIGAWARQQIVDRLKPTDKKLLQRLVVAGMAFNCFGEPENFAKRLGLKKKGHVLDPDMWPTIAAAEDETLAALPYEIVIGCCTERHNRLDWPLALAIAATLGADPSTDWLPTAEDLNVFSDKQLAAMAKERGVVVEKGTAKKGIVGVLIEAWKPGDLPAAFQSALKEGR